MRLQHLGSTYFFQKIQFIEIIHRSQLADILQCIIGWDKAKIFCIVFSIAYIQLGQNTETLYCLDPKYRNSVLPIFGLDRIQILCVAQIRNIEILFCLYLVETEYRDSVFPRSKIQKFFIAFIWLGQNTDTLYSELKFVKKIYTTLFSGKRILHTENALIETIFASNKQQKCIIINLALFLSKLNKMCKLFNSYEKNYIQVCVNFQIF